VQFGQPLLALVALELAPSPLVQSLLYDAHRLLVVLWQPNLLPHLTRQVSSLYGLEVQVAVAFVLKDCSVPTVG